MILLISCFITHQRAKNRFDRLDIFKHTLKSYARIEWEEIYLFVKLDQEFQPRRTEFLTFLQNTFPRTHIFFSDERLEYQHQWKDVITKLSQQDKLVWFTQNDDHVFVDIDTALVKEGVQLLEADTSRFKTLYFSHWPEILRLSGKLGMPQKVGNFLRFNATLIDSIQIFNSNYLKFLFLEINWNNLQFKRIDTMLLQRSIWGEGNIDESLQTIYVPLRELCRKFDGYNHVKMQGVPPLAPSYEIVPLDRSPETILATIQAPHESAWTRGNEFILPPEWVEASLALYRK